MSEAVTYDRLPSDRSIRLFRIDPETSAGVIEGSLEMVSLDYAPSYIALSYVWGTAPSSQPIKCNGRTLRITRNLEAALLQLRNKTTVRRYWIDQLCIDQECVEEKSQQIPLMGEIYDRARCVIVWLGAADEETPVVWSLLKNMLAHRGYTPTQAHDLYIEQGFDIFLQSADSEDGQAQSMQTEPVQIPPGTAPGWGIVRKFLSRPWFQRMWTFQEVVLSRRCQVFCGEYSMTWRDFSDACKAILIGDFNNFWSSVDHAIPLISVLRSLWHKDRYSNLSYLLASTRHLRAKEAVDKVFGLRALIDKQWARQIDVRYDRPVSYIYADAVKTCIKEEKSLCVLSSVEARRTNSAQLPSWIPDWTQPASNNESLGSRETSGRCEYCAAKDSKPVITIKDDPLQLQLRGFIVATITKLLNVKARLQLRDLSLTEPNVDTHRWSTNEWMKRHKRAAKACRVLQSNLEVQKTSDDRISESFNSKMPVSLLRPENFETAFRRTLLADRYPKIGQQRLHQPIMLLFFREHADWELKGCPKPVPAQVLLEHDAQIRSVMYQRRSFLAENHNQTFVGIALSTIREGDRICVLLGGDVVYVLRPQGEDWQFVAEAYVHGIMDGEAMDWAVENQIGMQDFTLV